ncbi:uncharacterized protein PF3D7_1120600-like [Centruroides vittatus]|uniref:uncharacterized protein PF3D7_1120600-like n=1 Tax=Centruroides vittatus TaxID=120091 RepID=UPI00350F3758
MTLLFCGYCGKIMKYPQLVSSTTPASLQDWLEGELENLGIDGVYTRYILSLLKEDGADLDPPECEHLFGKLEKSQYKQSGNYHNLGKELTVPLSGKLRQKWKSWEKEKLFKSEIYHCNCMVLFDSEERKKSVAVECLKSASEQKNGIEKLIDEVCAKLKKIQCSEVNSKECTKDELGSKVLLSSPQEQAEKYYAAFPALCGKIEPLAQLCQQQESKKVESVWERKKNSFDDGIGSSFYVQEYTDTPSEEELYSDCDNFDKHSDMSDKENDDEMLKLEVAKKISQNRNDQKPSFIVPKLKMSVHRIPFSVKCLPFTPINVAEKKIHNKLDDSMTQINRFNSNKTNEINLDENNPHVVVPVNDINLTETKVEDYNHAWENVIINTKELDVLSYPATLGVSFNDTLEKEDYIYNNFAGKFNNQLASIWAQNDLSNCNFEFNYPLIFEVSLKENIKKSCFSVKLLEQSIKDIKSIWTVSPDDFKLLSPSSSKLFPLAYLLANNIPSETEMKNDKQALEESTKFLSNEDNFIEVFDDDDENTDDSFPNVFPALGSEKRKSDSAENFSNFSLWKDRFYNDDDDDDDDYLDKEGTYSLWSTPSSVSILPLEPNEKPIDYSFEDNHSFPWGLDESKNFDESCHYIQHNHWCSDDCIHSSLETKTSLNKTKCTLTYHKGESLFVEVTPSPKPKAVTEINKISFERESTEHDFLEPPTSDSDDLLTSPKTHFQPIHQDSLEMENVDDNVTMMLTINADSPEECEFDNLIILPDAENDLEIQSKHDYLLEMDEYLPKKSDIFYDMQDMQNDIQPASFKELPEKNQFESDKKVYNDDIELSSLDISEFVQMWKNNYYKEKATNTEIPNFDCVSSQPPVEDFNEIKNLIEKLNSFDSNKEINTSEEQFLCSENISESVEMWRWSTNDSSDDWNLNENAFTSWQNINNLNDIISSKDVEKLDNKKNLEALKKEIEEEEDELFRDITRLKNETCSSNVESPETIFGTYCGYENEYFLESKQWSEDLEIPDFYYDYNGGKQDYSGWDSSDSKTYSDQFNSSLGLRNSDLESGSMFPLVPADKVLYSSDLEDEWRRSSRSFSTPHNRKIKNRHKIISQKKPCSFYLEGSCRRSDCKYSHDLSKITCRFWEEGSCFKGITCPFLHGYSSEGSFRHEECRHRKCNYTLDSETDFPSLSTSAPQDTEREISKDISSKCIRRKRRRGKVQHGLPISSSWPQQKGNKH